MMFPGAAKPEMEGSMSSEVVQERLQELGLWALPSLRLARL